jgi:uncharacterized membrane protein YuzA (DUF378 family)
LTVFSYWTFTVFVKKCGQTVGLIVPLHCCFRVSTKEDTIIRIKEIIMATLDTPMVERRHLTDRRADAVKHGLTAIDWVAMVLLIIGGLNWGLLGLTGMDAVATLFGEGTMASRGIYMLVGLSALYAIYMSFTMGDRK